MTVSYPLSWPSAIAPRSSRIRMHDVVAEDRSPFTGESQTHEHQGKWWTFELELPALSTAQGRVMAAFLANLRGRRGTVMLGDFWQESPRGVGTGTPVADTTGSPTPNRAREDVLKVRGLTTSTTGILLAGDYLQLGSGSGARLHMVTEDADSDGSGKASLTIWPPLRADVTDGASITLSAPKGVFRLDANERGLDPRVGSITEIETLRFREVL